MDIERTRTVGGRIMDDRLVLLFVITISIQLVIVACIENWRWLYMTYEYFCKLIRDQYHKLRKIKEDWTVYNSQKKE
jgi:hypothetical protein